MSQTEILSLLRKKEGLTPQQISKSLKIGISSINNSLKKLWEYNEVKFEKEKCFKTYKRRFYLNE